MYSSTHAGMLMCVLQLPQIYIFIVFIYCDLYMPLYNLYPVTCSREIVLDICHNYDQQGHVILHSSLHNTASFIPPRAHDQYFSVQVINNMLLHINTHIECNWNLSCSDLVVNNLGANGPLKVFAFIGGIHRQCTPTSVHRCYSWSIRAMYM
jgi:hypothetical protein